MNKRVYGIIGVSSIMANWNADFSGYPKTTQTGEIFGSDKALKHTMKRLWDDTGKKVLYIKSMRQAATKNNEITLVPRSLKERYEQIFDVDDLKKSKDITEVLKNLMRAVDVKNFGATFAEAGNNVSITGAVQIGQGFNKYKDSFAEEQQVLSPFRDSADLAKNKEVARSSTIGVKIVSNEAHYFYPFTINPMAYKEWVELGVTEGYTEEDYQEFKETSLVAVTSFATNAKVGCENEFALFMETKSDTYVPNLSTFVEFKKGKEKNIISITCDEFFSRLSDRILGIEVYYNPYTTVIEGNLRAVKMYDILTRQEV